MLHGLAADERCELSRVQHLAGVWCELDQLRHHFAEVNTDFAARAAKLVVLNSDERAAVRSLAERSGLSQQTTVAWLRDEWACRPRQRPFAGFRTLTKMFDEPVWRMPLHEVLGVDDASGALSA